MRQIVALSLLLGCGGNNKSETADTSDEADTDTDTDSDTDADTDADTDTDPRSHMRVIHVSPELGQMDMVVNDVLPPTLNALPFQDGTDWTERPVDTFNFKFKETGTGLEDAVFDFQDSLLDDTFHTFAIYGAAPNAGVLRFIDDPDGIFPGQIRLRWTHVATGIGPIDVTQLNGGIAHAVDLDYTDTLVDDFDAGLMTVGIDATDDGVPEWIYQDFDLAADSMVDLWIVNECDGCTPFLIAHQPNGNTPRRDILVVDTGDTGADTGPDTGADTGGDTGADTGP